MSKTVQISEELFSRLYAYHILNRREPEQQIAICNGLKTKMDSIQRRTEYTAMINKKQER